jgi:hypothetical protein
MIMLDFMNRLLTPPRFPDDEEKTRVAQTLHPLLLSFAVGLGMVAVCIPLFIVAKFATAAILLIFLALILGVYGLMRRGQPRLAAGIFVGGLWLGFAAFVTLAGGATTAPIAFFLVVAVFAGLLLGNTAAMWVGGLSSLLGLGLALLQIGGHPLPRVFTLPPLAGWWSPPACFTSPSP